MLKKIIFIGAPGVGKGTYAKLLCKKYNIPHISIGDIIRNEIKSNKNEDILQFINNGQLLPDEIIFNLLEKQMKYLVSKQIQTQNTNTNTSENNSNGNGNSKNGFILDGFPRNVNQAKYLIKYNLIDTVVHITLNQDIAIQKVLGRRTCDVCKHSFNIAHIVNSEYDMPSILPTYKDHKCTSYDRLTNTCHSKFIKRTDDNEKTLESRLHCYNVETYPIMKYFNDMCNKSSNFNSDVNSGSDSDTDNSVFDHNNNSNANNTHNNTDNNDIHTESHHFNVIHFDVKKGLKEIDTLETLIIG